MSEFINRISAQRRILQIVNSRAWQEELFGLSRQSVERWTAKNAVANSELSSLLHLVSEKLGFLANRSQDHLSNDYARVSDEIWLLTSEIEEKLCPLE